MAGHQCSGDLLAAAAALVLGFRGTPISQMESLIVIIEALTWYASPKHTVE